MSPSAVLNIRNLTKRFGGLVAVNDVTLSIESGKLNAVIGPNGAGKTTFFNLITGELMADHGNIIFGGRELVGDKPHQIVRRGISRTLQVKSVFGNLTVEQNVMAAVMAREGIASIFRSCRSFPQVAKRTRALLEEVGLTHLASRSAGVLSYGDVALLELALALANEPKLLLLDEPVCGMGPQETERTVEIIKTISKSVDVMLIEHDMEVVFGIADHITVLAQGAVLAQGSPVEIGKDSRVQEAYLGTAEDET